MWRYGVLRSVAPALLTALLLGAMGWAALAEPAEPSPAGLEFFEKKVRPVLVGKCFRCHSTQSQKPKAGLLLDSREGLLQGGQSGPAVVPGEPDRSLLIQAIRHTSEDLQMPPAGKLEAKQIADLEAWVKMGTPWPSTPTTRAAGSDAGKGSARTRQFWSFRPVVELALPKVKNARWPQSPVDFFILAKLEEKGLTPAPSADRRTLIRRATFDLTGLPPTPEEVDAFLQDSSPNAFEKAVERLLASPHYGERWGRHWLDVVRYADTAGCNSDFPIPDAYRYRNWVIQAFNQDKPYDQFLREQVAGDLLPAQTDEERFERVVATGYLALSRRYGSSDPEFHLTIEDTIDNLGKAVLGLSLSCARCHDHKFDPLPTSDYYAIYGIFASTRYPFPGMEDFPHAHSLVPLATGPEAAVLQSHQAKLSELDQRLFRVKFELKSLQRTAGAAKVPGETTAGGRTVEQVRAEMKSMQGQLAALERRAPAVARAYAVSEGPPGNARIQLKGDPGRSGAEVPRGFLQVLGGQKLPEGVKASGRYELAQWLTDPRNPLTARVMVNRLWQYHFGKGIVQTPNDFGSRGQAPTHPELLDYLTRRFVDSGWSIKAMHRLILLSRAYQMACVDHPGHAQVDAHNDLLWRFDRRRLSAEEVRDAMLAVSGALDRSVGGRQPFPAEQELRYTQHRPFEAVYETQRRSVYLMRQRNKKHPFLDLFDAADPKASTAVRPVSTTPLQALFLMNDPFVHDQARQFARRLLEARTETRERIELAHRLAFARAPTADEIQDSEGHLQRCAAALQEAEGPEQELSAATWASYVRVLLSSNEFLFID